MAEMFIMVKSEQLSKLRGCIENLGELTGDYSSQEVYDQRIFELLDEYFTTLEVLHTDPEELEQTDLLLDEFATELIDRLISMFKDPPPFRVVEIYENKVLLALQWRETTCLHKQI